MRELQTSKNSPFLAHPVRMANMGQNMTLEAAPSVATRL